jgi:hypothetical protein
MSEHSKADHNYQTTVATVVSVARRAKSIFENSSEPARKRAFLNLILQNPTVNEKKLYFTIASPFNLVLADRPNWLDMVRDIGTFWKTNKEHIWLPNIKQGFFGITQPTAEEMVKYR